MLFWRGRIEFLRDTARATIPVYATATPVALIWIKYQSRMSLFRKFRQRFGPAGRHPRV